MNPIADKNIFYSLLMEAVERFEKTGRVLAISGSLRAESTNTILLRAGMLVAPAELEIDLFEQLANIPHFNPDIEADCDSAALGCLRNSIKHSCAVIISTPEYAHGIPGTLKNALDWLVGGGELYEKPVAIWNVSNRGLHAKFALKEVLSALNARVLSSAEVTMDLSNRRMSAQDIATEPALALSLTSSLRKILEAYSERRVREL